MELGHAFDVHFVDHRFGVRDPRWPVTRPVEERVDHHTQHHVAGRIGVVEAARVVEVVSEQRRIPVVLARRRLRVRVEQHLGGIAARTDRRLVGTVDPIAVALAGLHRRQIAVPHVGVDVDQLDTLFVPVLVEQTEFDTLGRFAEEGEVGARPVERRSEWVGRSGPAFHWHPCRGVQVVRVEVVRVEVVRVEVVRVEVVRSRWSGPSSLDHCQGRALRSAPARPAGGVRSPRQRGGVDRRAAQVGPRASDRCQSTASRPTNSATMPHTSTPCSATTPDGR